MKAINNPMALAVGTSDGRVLIYTLGLLQVADIQLTPKVGARDQQRHQVVLGVVISDDYSRVNVFHSESREDSSERDASSPIQLSVFTLNHLRDHSVQYLALSHVYSRIVTLMR